MNPQATNLSIAGRSIGAGAKSFVIAEAGVNHNGDVELARRLVDAAADIGADAVKFQTFDPAALAAATAPKAAYQEARATGSSQREMLEKLVLSHEAHVELKARAEARGIVFMSSPFDEGSADFLERLGVPAFKIPSGELTNLPFLVHLARKGLPILMSTGMSTLAEVGEAVGAIKSTGHSSIALFHCVSSYPAEPGDSNLRAMASLRTAFAVPTGWSDHTMGITMSVAAVAMGAELIEKHITLDRSLPGPDHAASLDVAEFGQLVSAIRAVESAFGDGVKQPRSAEAAIAAVARKSLHWRNALRTGSTIRREDMVALRPGTGLSPARTESIIGRRILRPVEAGAMIAPDDVADSK
jgi:N,N'-diacetyllegionaminate synthase